MSLHSRNSHLRINNEIPFGCELSFANGYIVIADPYATVLYASTCVMNKDHSFFEEMQGEVTNKIWGGEMNEAFYEHMGDELRNKKKPFIVSAESINSRRLKMIRSVHITPILDVEGNIKYFLEVEPVIYGTRQKRKFQEDFCDMYKNQRKFPLKIMTLFQKWLGLTLLNFKNYHPVKGQSCDISDITKLLECLFLQTVDPKILYSLKDKSLLNAAKNNHDLFGDIYLKYKDVIFRYFYLRCDHNVFVAEDLMQNTFIRAFNSLERFSFRDSSYISYLLTVAHNLLVDYYRKNRVISLREDMFLVKDDHMIIDAFSSEEKAETVWQVIRSLPRPYRKIVGMKYKMDMSNKAIADEMKKSTDAVKCILTRALKKLRNNFQIRNLN